MTDSPAEVVTWADGAMFRSEPMPENAVKGPKVYLINMTPDPLGAIAAMAKMYKGEVVRDLRDIPNYERYNFFQDILKTHLKAPFEAVTFHFLIEGVTRSFTHQMVRQRTAVYAQESLRFAVKENLDEETPLPPSLAGLPNDDPRVVLWRGAVNRVQDTYEALVGSGVPAEDARGLLPHSTTTRLHYVTNLRGLYEHLGNRLCTQAQFEWRQVATGIVDAIRNYDAHTREFSDDSWQQSELADLFRPICYMTGKCEFKASFDRACRIRNRVEANHEIGRHSSEWHKEHDKVVGNPIVSGVGPQSVVRDETERPVFIGAIHPAEWLADPTAAR